MELRTATPDDAAALAALVVAVAHHAYADLEPVRVDALDPDDEVAEWRTRLGDGSGHVARVGSAGGHTVAASCWRLEPAEPDDGARSGTLTHLLVHPAAQNAGVGTVLLADAEDALRDLGGTSAQLRLHREAWWAARFVAARGWERADEAPEAGSDEGWRRVL